MTFTASVVVLLSAAIEASALPPDPSKVARMPDAGTLASLHERFASEPHVAGTAGDARTIERLAETLRGFGAGVEGWEVEVEEFFPMLPRPVKARLEIVGGDIENPAADAPPARRGVIALRTDEPNLAIDPATAHPDLDIAWNAWSGSGLVEAGVVYVNYGRREDFARLKELGVDPRGKIALARYGGNFRGYKARFAEAAGCVGLVIFTDPADSGFKRGKTWPDGGGWANADCIQRGSLATLPYAGDALTPGRYAGRDAVRLDPATLPLPRIPVQPIGYGAAIEILRRMRGPAAPAEWKGGLACDYALFDASDALRLRLEVEQVREVVRTANVIVRLRGATRPDEAVYIGAHHDAWCFGAADPLAGTICMLESARNFAALARAGERSDRTLVFCAWGAEEYGIIGSSEFVERDATALGAKAVAYINLDMAAMGLRPGAGVSPTLRSAVTRALAAAPGPHGEGRALDVWSRLPAGSPDGRPAYGDLGGGSDHVAFWCHAGVPSVSLSAGGSEGVSYHSNYDTVAWYRAIVGADYAAARLVTGITNAMAAEFANAGAPAIAATPLVEDSAEKAKALVELARAKPLPADIVARLERLAAGFESCRTAAAVADARALASPGVRDDPQWHRLRSAWIAPGGLEGRPWYRNLFAATDRYSGYGTSAWPLLREAIEDAGEAVAAGGAGDPDRRDRALAAAHAAIGAYEAVAAEIRAALDRLAG